MTFPTLADCNRIYKIKRQDDLLDGIAIDERINVELLKDHIYATIGDCDVIPKYAFDVDYLKLVINNFFLIRKDIISKLLDTTQFDYNPIHNYDRTEERDTGEEKAGTEQNGGKRSGSNSGTTENSVSAYNNPVYVGRDKTATSGTTTDEYTNDTLTTDTRREKEKIHAYGNIGVTTTQQMIEQERRIVQFNIYDWISGKLEDEICTCLY